MNEANEYKVLLKAKARDNMFKTPFQNKAVELTLITYMHNILDDNVTLVLCYDGNKRKYTYTGDDAIDMAISISKDVSISYKQKMKDAVMNELIF